MKYTIYQLDATISAAHNVQFMAYDFASKHGGVQRKNYAKIYEGTIPVKDGRAGAALNEIFRIFNLEHPADFTGHSLSVSDVVVLETDTERTAHYCDPIGWKDISATWFADTDAASARNTKEMSVEERRKAFPMGTRVRLIEMRDPYAPIAPGTCGSVNHVDGSGQIHMFWDNGRTLALVPEVDSFEKIELTDEVLEQLWQNFADVPMNPDTEKMEAWFLHFSAGTDREDIWKWFDQHHSKGVAYLLYDADDE